MSDPVALATIVVAAAGATSTFLGAFLRDKSGALAEKLTKKINKNRTPDKVNEKTIAKVISGHPSGQVSVTLETGDRNIVIDLGDMLKEADAVKLLKSAIKNADTNGSSPSPEGSAEPH